MSSTFTHSVFISVSNVYCIYLVSANSSLGRVVESGYCGYGWWYPPVLSRLILTLFQNQDVSQCNDTSCRNRPKARFMRGQSVPWTLAEGLDRGFWEIVDRWPGYDSRLNPIDPSGKLPAQPCARLSTRQRRGGVSSVRVIYIGSPVIFSHGDFGCKRGSRFLVSGSSPPYPT